MAFLSYVSGHMNLLSKDVFPLLPTKIENASTPSLIKIKFGLRFRLRNSGIKTIKRLTMKMFLKQSRWYSRLVLAGPRRQLSENDSLSSNYSPHWLHFSPMRETTIEEMCDCAFLCVCACTCMFLWFPILLLPPSFFLGWGMGSQPFLYMIHWPSYIC